MGKLARLILAVLATNLLMTDAGALAVVKKELQIESVPSGAKVYLPQGTRNKLLGTTPFVYKAEFHSQFSVHRLLFKMPLHEDRIVKVSAEQRKVKVKLKSVGVTVGPKTHTDAAQRKLQTRVNPVIEKVLPELTRSKTSIPFDLRGTVRVTKGKSGSVVILPIKISDWRNKPKGNAKSQREMFARTVWKELGPTIVVPLARALNGIGGLKGLALDMHYDERQFGYHATPKTQTTIEVRCVPGVRYEQRPVVRHINGRQVTEYLSQPVLDPCLRREPVEKKTVKFAPSVAAKKDQAQGYFLVKLPVGKQPVAFSKVSILLQDKKKETVFRQGDVASLLPID